MLPLQSNPANDHGYHRMHPCTAQDLQPLADCDAQLKQQVQAIAAPLAAAAESDAKREAHMRAKLAAVEPRQRSTRSSAAQAKKALTRQAAVSSAPTLVMID